MIDINELKVDSPREGLAVIRPPQELLQDEHEIYNIAECIKYHKDIKNIKNLKVVALDLGELERRASAAFDAVMQSYVVCENKDYKLVCFNLKDCFKNKYNHLKLNEIVPLYDKEKDIPIS